MKIYCFSFFFMSLIQGIFLPNVEAQSQGNRPNILFCLADDASLQHFGAYGNRWVKTPAFDRVANQGLLFANGYTPNAKCAPSRACILTGRNPWQLEEIGNHLAYWPEKYVSIMELIGENGYATGYTGKGWGPGDPGQVNGEARKLTGPAFKAHKLVPPTAEINALDYAANFEAFLDNKDTDQPFFFWFGSTEPHRKYEYGSGRNKGGKKPDAIGRIPAFWPDNDSVRNDIMDYAYEVEYFDQQIGKMLSLLETRGLLSNTLVVITSDNGMPFPRVKGFQYEMSNHMPLAMMWPEGIRRQGSTVRDFVSFIDFAPTFLEISGTTADANPVNKPQGRSLTDIFYSATPNKMNPARNYMVLGQERHDVGRPDEVGYPIRSIIKDGFMYIRNFEPDRWPSGNPETGYLNTDGSPTKTTILNANRKDPGNSDHWLLCFGKRHSEEFYHLSKDPECMNDLINSPRHADRIKAMRDQLMAELEKQGDPRMFGKGYLFDQYPPTEGVDFYQKFLRGEHPKTGWVNPSDYETDPRIIKGK